MLPARSLKNLLLQSFLSLAACCKHSSYGKKPCWPTEKRLLLYPKFAVQDAEMDVMGLTSIPSTGHIRDYPEGCSRPSRSHSQDRPDAESRTARSQEKAESVISVPQKSQQRCSVLHSARPEDLLSLDLACSKIQNTPLNHLGVECPEGNRPFQLTPPSRLVSAPQITPSLEISSESTGFTVCDGYHRTQT